MNLETKLSEALARRNIFANSDENWRGCKFIDTYFIYGVESGRELVRVHWSRPRREQPRIPEGMEGLTEDENSHIRLFERDTRPQDKRTVSIGTLRNGAFRHLRRMFEAVDGRRRPLDDAEKILHAYSDKIERKELGMLGLGNGRDRFGEWEPIEDSIDGYIDLETAKEIAAAQADHQYRTETTREEFEANCLSSVRLSTDHMDHIWHSRFEAYQQFAATRPDLAPAGVNHIWLRDHVAGREDEIPGVPKSRLTGQQESDDDKASERGIQRRSEII